MSKAAKCDCGACAQARLGIISPRTGRVPGTHPVVEIDERDPAVVAVTKKQIEDECA